jgi:hypothetical protein
MLYESRANFTRAVKVEGLRRSVLVNAFNSHGNWARPIKDRSVANVGVWHRLFDLCSRRVFGGDGFGDLALDKGAISHPDSVATAR